MAESKAKVHGEQSLRLKCEKVSVTPGMARILRDTAHFERQRTISEKNVARLAHEMKKGWFINGTPIFICVLPEGQMQIVNGNHTLEAVFASGTTIALTFVYLSVSNIEEVAKVYATFDNHKARTWMDAIRATGMSEDLPLAKYTMGAIGVIMQGFKYEYTPELASRNARFLKVEEYTEAAEILEGCLKGAPKTNTRAIKRAAVLGVALMTAKYQPTAAIEFWRGMAMDDGLSSNDPRKSLLRYLLNTTSESSPVARNLQSMASSLAWNAHYLGRTLEAVKPNQAKGFRLIGTPWHKGPPENDPPVAVATPMPSQTSKPDALPLFMTGMKVTDHSTVRATFMREP